MYLTGNRYSPQCEFVVHFQRINFYPIVEIYYVFFRYYAALAHTGLLTLTTPYLDSGGAGVVISAGRALYRGEPSHLHHTNDEVLGVMGTDFPLTYFHR